MANHKTAAQRYNDWMDKIFERAAKDWPTSGLHGPSDQDILAHTLKKIKFLESIYMTGGINNLYSRNFQDAAVREREELCQESSALHDILRD